MFITIEGIDGAGKSTLIEKLASCFSDQGFNVVVTKEPGGCPLADRIKEMVLQKEIPIGPEAETLLFLAARMQHIQEVIAPAHQRGDIVLCDRFTDSTIAYQGYGREMGAQKVGEMCDYLCEELKPDRTLLIDIDPLEAQKRLDPKSHDRIESETLAFHQRVRKGFLQRAEAEPDRFHVIDGSLPSDEVFVVAIDWLKGFLAWTPS